MSLRDQILDWIEENYGDLFISEELEDKITELEEFIESSFRIAEDEESDDDDPVDYYGDMSEFNDEE